MLASTPDATRLTPDDTARIVRDSIAARLEQERLGRPPHRVRPGPRPSHAIAPISTADAEALASVVNAMPEPGVVPEAMLGPLMDVLQRAHDASVPVKRCPFDTPSTAAEANAQRALAIASQWRQIRLANEHDAAAPELEAAALAKGLPGASLNTPAHANAALRGIEQAWRDAAASERGERPTVSAPGCGTSSHALVTIPTDQVSHPAYTQAPREHAMELAVTNDPQRGELRMQPDGLPPATAYGGGALSSKAAAGAEVPAAQQAPLLSEQVQQFIAGETKKLKPGEAGKMKALRDIDVAQRHFVSLVGDIRLDALDWTAVAAFKEAALMIPQNNGKGIYAGLDTLAQVRLADAIDERDIDTVRTILGGRSEAQIVAAMNTAPVPRSKKKSVNKHLSSVKRAILPWYRKNRTKERDKDWTPLNREFFSKQEIKEQASFLRTALSDDEIKAVFGSPIYAGHGGGRLRQKPGADVPRDAYWWVPMIGLHQGARLDEILQLETNQVEKVEGVDVLTFGRDPTKAAKTPGSRRRVAIHPALIEAGFLDYVSQLRRAGERHLFGEIEPGPDGNRSYTFSKWWCEYRRRHGIYEAGRDFHALRHTLITRLHNADVKDTLVRAVVGHVQEGVNAAVYLAGYKLDRQREALGRVRFDLPHVHPGGGIAR